MKNNRILLALFAICVLSSSVFAGGSLGGKEKAKDQQAIGAQLPQEMIHAGADANLVQSAEAAFAKEMESEQENPQHIQGSSTQSGESTSKYTTESHAALKMDRAARKSVKRNFRENKKDIRKKLKEAREAQKNSPNNDAELLLLVILAILLPPLAVFLYEGLGTNFWIDLILTLFFWLPGVIYALIVILAR